MPYFPIHHTFAPLADFRFAMRSTWLLLQPWRYRRGAAVEALRAELQKEFSCDVALFSSGREAVLALLRSLDIGKGDEVIVQAYTCIVVANAIAATGAKPIYADIEQDTLSLDPHATEKLMTPRTKAVICQHTFGIPAPLSELRELCDRHRLPLIEDCAHVIPDTKGPIGVARTGDYVLLSFGRDKAISGVTGGALLSTHPDTAAKLTQCEQSAAHLHLRTIAALLWYAPLYWKSRLFYGLGLGKITLALASRMGLLLPIVTTEEKAGKQSTTLHTLPHACAALILSQWKRLPSLNSHRRRIADILLKEGRKRGWPIVAGACAGLPLQKLPLFVHNADAIRSALKRKNIYLSDGWTGCVVCPSSADASAAGYAAGTDPNAEKICMQILSLPTHPTMTTRQARTLIRILDPLLRPS